MNPLAFLRGPVVTNLGWALVHFLWQGALIALLLGVADAAMRKAHARYAAACGAMVLMVIAIGVTFFRLGVERQAPPLAVAAALSSAPDRAGAVPPAGETLEAQMTGWLPWLVCAWAAGVLALSVRSMGGWMVAQRLKSRQWEPAGAEWAQKARRLAQTLAVSRPVRLSWSALAEAPAVVGWLRPVILIPTAAFAGCDARQLEALLAHELAHIRRHDYLVNLIQTAVETLLFYHPAVWWVSQRIRAERENCCDDLAVAACGDVLTYARALTRIEELRSSQSQFAMAANGGALFARIRRMLGNNEPAGHTARTWLAGAIAVSAVFAVWVAARSADAGELSPAAVVAAASPQASPAPQRPGGSFIGDLAAAGYPNLTVDQLVAFKIHGVTAQYIRDLRAAGVSNPSPDELVAFRIHNVMPEWAREIKALGFGDPSPDDLVAMRIHNVTSAYANEIKALGLTGMKLDDLVAFRIHNVDASAIKQMESLGLGKPTPDEAVALRIHNVTPELVRGLKDAGITKLDYDGVVAAAIHGITPAFIKEAQSHGFKNLTLDQLIRLKQAGVLSPDNL